MTGTHRRPRQRPEPAPTTAEPDNRVPGSGSPLFPLGKLSATPQALERAEAAGINIAGLLIRHEYGDWGDVSRSDARANDAALRDGARVLSAYGSGTGHELWIITEADRAYTTVLRPEDY